MPFPHLRYFLKGRDKVVVTNDGQSVEHVDGLEQSKVNKLCNSWLVIYAASNSVRTLA